MAISASDKANLDAYFSNNSTRSSAYTVGTNQMSNVVTAIPSLASSASKNGTALKAASQFDWSPFTDVLSEIGSGLIGAFDSYTNAMSTSALKAQTELINRQNAFNKREAEISREFAQTSADKAMAFESKEAQTARDWSEMMSNTAYQRAVADMRSAGLNPVLAFGSPASAGQASYASGKTASSSAASAAGNLDPSSAKKVDTSIPALIAGLLGSAAKIFEAVS